MTGPLRFYRHRIGAVVLLLGSITAPLAAAQQPGQNLPPGPPIHVGSYNIDLTLEPADHAIRARSAVTLTALADAPSVMLQLNPALRITGAADAAGNPLAIERTAPGSSGIRVTPSAPLRKGTTATWTFTYSGVLNSSDVSTTSIGRAASIGNPVSYLLYQSCWFPVSGLGTNRFAATIHVHAPAGLRVLSSGQVGPRRMESQGEAVVDFDWPHAGFPGTIIAGKFREIAPGTSPIHLFRISGSPEPSSSGSTGYAALAARQYRTFLSQFGPLPWAHLNLVELPKGAVSAASAPELSAFVAGSDSSVTAGLLANTIAHQWWGQALSPASRNDAWITNGMCRYADLAFLRETNSRKVFSDALRNVSASALAYTAFPVSDAARYPASSPEFAALTYDKGAMIFRMLRWQIGDTAFTQTLRQALAVPAASISRAGLQRIAESASHQNLAPFFAQWLDSTVAPELRNTWTLYRLNKGGYRLVGQIRQNTDLFRMPVELRIDAGGKTITRRIDVSGTETAYVVDTADPPKRIAMDPDRRLLRTSPAMQVRVAILLGLQNRVEGNLEGAIAEYQRALKIDSTSSLASYRLGEVYFAQHNYQAAADAFRDALRGDGLPSWTEVWSDVQLGRIYDVLGQRDRAINQYREALQTGDNTGGALDETRKCIEHPCRLAATP